MQFYSKFQLLTCLNSLELLISISNVYHAATDLHLVVSARGSPVIQPTAIFGPPQNKSSHQLQLDNSHGIYKLPHEYSYIQITLHSLHAVILIGVATAPALCVVILCFVAILAYWRKKYFAQVCQYMQEFHLNSL